MCSGLCKLASVFSCLLNQFFVVCTGLSAFHLFKWNTVKSVQEIEFLNSIWLTFLIIILTLSRFNFLFFKADLSYKFSLNYLFWKIVSLQKSWKGIMNPIFFHIDSPIFNFVIYALLYHLLSYSCARVRAHTHTLFTLNRLK